MMLARSKPHERLLACLRAGHAAEGMPETGLPDIAVRRRTDYRLRQPTVTTHFAWQRPGLSVPPPLAGRHRLNGLPVQRSVIHARRHGRGARRAAIRRFSMQICYTLTLERPTLILASRRGRHSQFLKPPAMINGHVLKLEVETG